MARSNGASSNRGDRYGSAFADAAEKYGISETYLRKIAMIESTGNSEAVKGSSRGLMQFQSAAASEVGLRNPFDPVASIYAAAKLADRNNDYLSQKLGRPVKDWELYLAHQQGRYGAETLLQSPERSATSALSKYYDNPGKVVTGNGGTRDMDCREFTALWQKRYDMVRPLGKDARMDRDFADQTLDERQERGLGRDLSSRNTFNGASAHNLEHQENAREARLRQTNDAPNNRSPFQQSFQEATLPDRSNDVGPVPKPIERGTVRPSPYDRDIFTPLGNG